MGAEHQLNFGSTMTKMRVQPKANPSKHSAHSTRPSVFNRERNYVVQAKPEVKPRPKVTFWKDFTARRTKAKGKISKWQLFTIVRRLVVIAAACQYIQISMVATWRTMGVLRAMKNPTESFGVFTSSFIAGYVGDGHIRDSTLVQDVLGGDTTPRNYTIFLESETKTSVENCSEVPLFNSGMYNYNFLSLIYMQMVNDTSYNTSVLSKLELIAVVVDCSFTALVSDDTAVLRVYNLVRSRDDADDLYLVSVSMSVQDYEITEQQQFGPALLGMLTIINVTSADSVEEFYMVAQTYPYQRLMDFRIYEFVGITNDSYLELRSVPKDPIHEPVATLVTARNRGFYDGDVQSNIHSMYAFLDTGDTITTLSRWEWVGATMLTDSWAWVHGLHFFFGMQTIFSLTVLLIVTYQNFRIGKIWVGAPFASISTATLISRGILVIMSWFVDAFWALYEFALSNAAILAGHESVYVHTELVHADLLVVYLGTVAFMSWVIRERIDPAFAIFLFEIIQNHRLYFIRSFPGVLNEIVTYSDSVFYLSKAQVSASLNAMSPMDFWSSFQIPSKDPTFLAASYFPEIAMLSVVVCYAILRKIYRRIYPETIQRTSSHNSSTNEKVALALKSNLTNFEISTGAELQTRFGIISDYNNYVYFKGMKFASADGVYCSGYVIVNGKFLVKSKDLLAIVMIKLVRARFTNVYTYEVEGNTVKDTATLVYPTTFTWSDLTCLNVSVLL